MTARRIPPPARRSMVAVASIAALVALPILAGLRLGLDLDGVVPDPIPGRGGLPSAIVAGFSGLFDDDTLLVLAGLIAGLLAACGRRREAVAAVVAVVGADLIGRLVKTVAGEPRPYLLGDAGFQVPGLPRVGILLVVAVLLLAAIRPRWRTGALAASAAIVTILALTSAAALVVPEQVGHDGFPSGHAKGSMVVALVALAAAWPTRFRGAAIVAAVVVVGGVGLSRLYLDAHYPVDVVAGWVVGLATFGLVREAIGLGGFPAGRVARPVRPWSLSQKRRPEDSGRPPES